jgi:hypothetical protein
MEQGLLHPMARCLLKKNHSRANKDVVEQFYIYAALLNPTSETDVCIPVFVGFRIFQNAMDLGFVVSFPNENGSLICKAVTCLIMFVMEYMVLPRRKEKGLFTIHHSGFKYDYKYPKAPFSEDFYRSIGFV